MERQGLINDNYYHDLVAAANRVATSQGEYREQALEDYRELKSQEGIPDFRGYFEREKAANTPRY